MEELAEEGTERLEASRVGAMDDDTGEGERRDGVGGEGEALAADGSDYLSLKGCDKGHVSELDREVRGRGDEGVELEDDAVWSVSREVGVRDGDSRGELVERWRGYTSVTTRHEDRSGTHHRTWRS
jgi:hypothetical protein